MAIVPINVARVSQNLQAFNLLTTVQSSQLRMFRLQNQLSTGLRFTVPSQDPVRASMSGRLDRKVDTLNVVQKNLDTANATLREGESAISDAVELLRDAHTLASEATSDTSTEEERRSLRVVVDSMIDQALSVANRKHLDGYLFSGNFGPGRPFELTNNGVLYHGDNGRLLTTVDSDFSEDSFTISGLEVFGAVSDHVQGVIDLNPGLTAETRLCDLRGANDRGVSLGRISVTDGSRQVEIDLVGADTVGDVIDKLNEELPDTLEARINGSSIDIVPDTPLPLAIVVEDVAGGRAAADLGIRQPTPVTTLTGVDLDPRLTERTPLAAMHEHAGVNLSGGIRIHNGTDSVEVSFDSAQTVEDVLNAINTTSIGVWARIGPDGNTVQILNRRSGTDMYIEDVNGSAAAALGVRSQHGGVRLSDLNDGRGVQTVLGYDFRISTADGTAIDIDLDLLDLNTATLSDLAAMLNAQGGGRIYANVSAASNGIVIADLTSGANPLSIERLNLSPAIDGLGLNVTAVGNTLTGQDVRPVRTNGAFTALLELRDGLDRNDRQAITAAGERLNNVMERMREAQGRLASKARSMLDRSSRLEDEATATEVLRSDVRDVDFTEAIVRFQQVQNALQANLATASRVLDLSLLNFLR